MELKLVPSSSTFSASQQVTPRLTCHSFILTLFIPLYTHFHLSHSQTIHLLSAKLENSPGGRLLASTPSAAFVFLHSCLIFSIVTCCSIATVRGSTVPKMSELDDEQVIECLDSQYATRDDDLYEIQGPEVFPEELPQSELNGIRIKPNAAAEPAESPISKKVREELERQNNSQSKAVETQSIQPKFLSRPKSHGNDVKAPSFPPAPAPKVQKAQTACRANPTIFTFAPKNKQVEPVPAQAPESNRARSHTPKTR